MPTTSLLSTAPNVNYNDPLNWSNGAPATGYTVLISTSPPNGPITATNTVLDGQNIQLSASGKFYTAGTSSFTSTTTLTDTNPGASTPAVQFSGAFTNGGTITNVNTITVFSPVAAAPLLLNTGTIAYTTNPTGGTIGSYSISAFDASRPTAITVTNNGVINVSSPAGANQGPSSTLLVTGLQIYGLENGSGLVNIVGGTPNRTAPPTNLTADESTVEFPKDVTGTQTFNLNDGALKFDGANSGTVNFQDSAGILDLPDQTAAPQSTLTINGFRSGDAIGLGTTAFTRAAYDTVTGRIDLFAGANMVNSLNIVASGGQNFATAMFTIGANAADAALPESAHPSQGYLLVNAAAPCYCPGTLIRTVRGEVPVETLEIGDRVMTVSNGPKPIRWIGRRSYDGRFIEGRTDLLPVRVRAGSLGAGLPRRDLFVSPLHAMFLDGALVPAGALVNGVSVTQAAAVDEVHYIHIELAKHDVIWAEGAASETFVDDNSRGLFHNAHEFAALYPRRKRVAARYCAPRVEDGERLAAIRCKIDQLAGIEQPAAAAMRGCLDGGAATVLRGWAQDIAQPDVAVCLDVVVDGAVAQRVLANRFRADLRQAGLGSGRHGFEVDLAPFGEGRHVMVRRTGDGFVLGECRLLAA